ncbi:MAG: hypothetical protein ACI9ZD_002147 [Paracoccaceae bacterium]|jgi:hypothetical protein
MALMRVGDTIHVDDSFQNGYDYVLSSPIGAVTTDRFRPHHSPKEMLKLGVFEGKYCNDCQNEFPADWFENAKLSAKANPEVNYFGIKSRQPLGVWRQRGWIVEPDPRGWFQWYCRYFLGRRLVLIDEIQIKRWRAFARHTGQVRANCEPANIFCRPRQRQALLQWAYDPLI